MWKSTLKQRRERPEQSRLTWQKIDSTFFPLSGFHRWNRTNRFTIKIFNGMKKRGEKKMRESRKTRFNSPKEIQSMPAPRHVSNFWEIFIFRMFFLLSRFLRFCDLKLRIARHSDLSMPFVLIRTFSLSKCGNARSRCRWLNLLSPKDSKSEEFDCHFE